MSALADYAAWDDRFDVLNEINRLRDAITRCNEAIVSSRSEAHIRHLHARKAEWKAELLKLTEA